MPRPRVDDYLKLSAAAPLVYEISGVSRSMWSLAKWASHGRISSTGSIVKLKITKRLGRIYTTRRWLEEFIRSVG